MTLDTNLLVRVVVQDDVNQARAAAEVLRTSAVLAVTLPCLCEMVWVLRKIYRFTNANLAESIRNLIAAPTVVVDLQAVNAGLAMLDAGGDFADGVIAHQGEWLGGTTFVSFDREAVTLLLAQGRSATLLS